MAESPSPTPQRRWQALCPGCGAPVEFASAASASAVCSFCRSTLLRDGEALRRIGLSAELFDDHSPLQLGATGRHQGLGFTVVGRLQYRYAEGTWNEWHVLFDGEAGKSAWLSEDNGAYVLSVDLPLAEPPELARLEAGTRVQVAGEAWSVGSVVQASLLAAQGELPRPPQLEGEFWVADLRNERGQVGTLDGSGGGAAQWSVGESVALSALQLKGLREGVSEATLTGRQLPCPSCGAPIALTLSTTQAVSCGQCRAVVDVSQGLGGDLKHYAQNNAGPGGLEPQIPLGRVGRLALGAEGALDWQVVGYMERCDQPDDDEDEQTFWREYLLYHRTAGFAFLVDAEDGWSWMRPMTGVPQTRAQQAVVAGVVYRQLYRYAATVTWVQGEFYWRVRRQERATVTDFVGPGGAKLSLERTSKEAVWSMGQALRSDEVAQAFRLPPEQRAALRRDPSPLSGLTSSTSGGWGGLSQGVMILVVVIVVMLLMARCDGDDCASTRQTYGPSSAEYQQCLRNQSTGGSGRVGGSYGGFSSGGGHK